MNNKISHARLINDLKKSKEQIEVKTARNVSITKDADIKKGNSFIRRGRILKGHENSSFASLIQQQKKELTNHKQSENSSHKSLVPVI